MALKKYKDIVNTDEGTLSQDLSNVKTELARLKLEHKLKGLPNPSQIRHLRREIAQIKTELRKRKIYS